MKHIFFCTVLFFALAVFGSAKKFEAKLAEVDIGKGKITHIERITDGEFLHHSNKVLKNIPPCTRICYTLTPGKESYIRCELWLPDNWNGRLWGVGNGGIAGNLRTANFDSYMRDGDAVVTTDMGTSKGAVNKPDVWLDFAYRSTHLMTVTAKSLIKAYYGKEVKYSYFTGRSTGGGQALHEAQRYPEDYDGILSEVPVVNRMLLFMIMSYRAELLFDSKGNPVFCEQQVKNLKKAAIYATAIAAIFLFAQCTKENSQPAASQTACGSINGIKIAFVDIDSLLNNYELSITINKEMLRKEENMRMTLSEKAKDIQADIEDFQRKIENNVYATQKRAEEEQARIIKRREDYDRLSERLAGELAAESQKNNVVLHDSINAYLKEFNKEKGYDLIISRVGDNLLYANEALDITKEVIEGLNKRYQASEK